MIDISQNLSIKNENMENKYEETFFKNITDNNKNNFALDYEILNQNIDFKANDPSKLAELELLFLPKIKNLEFFFIFKNLRELNIISPILELDSDKEDKEDKEAEVGNKTQIKTQIKNTQQSNMNDISGFPSNPPLQCFSTNGIERLCLTLTTLRLVNCNLKEIDKHFTKLKYLQVLSLGENKIKEIRNLHNCNELKTLYLYSNRITKIEYLQDCSLLEEIDLSDNLISKVENLDALNYLAKLNLSANSIDNLMNINYVRYIRNLSDLKFNDENFGPNPICELNTQSYFDHVMKLKPDLKVLDFYLLKQDDDNLVCDKLIDNFDLYTNFNNKIQKCNKKVIDAINSENKEILMIKDFYTKIKFTYEEKFKQIEREGDKENFSNYTEYDLTIEKILNLELEFYFEILNKNKSVLLEKNRELEENYDKKKKVLEMYLELLLTINNFLNFDLIQLLEKNNSDYSELKILQTECIYDYFKRFFPPSYFDYMNAVPLIIIRFVHKSNKGQVSYSGGEFESYMEFSNYDMIIIDNISEFNFADLVDAITNNKFNFDNKMTQRIKFYNVKEYSEILNKKENFIGIFVDKNKNKNDCSSIPIIKYLIYFFNILDAGKLMTSLTEKGKNLTNTNTNTNMELNLNKSEEIYYELVKNNNNNNENLKSVYEKLEEGDKLNKQILEKEKNIDILLQESYEMINELCELSKII